MLYINALEISEEKKTQKTRKKKIFKIMAENFLKIMKNVMPQICEVWRML